MQPRYTVAMKLKTTPTATPQFIYYDTTAPDYYSWSGSENITGADDSDVAFFTETQVMSIVAGTTQVHGTSGTRLNDYEYTIYQWLPTPFTQLAIDQMLQEALYENAVAKLTEEELDILRRRLR